MESEEEPQISGGCHLWNHCLEHNWRVQHLPTHRAGKEEAQPTIVKETAKAKLKSGLGIARMTGSIMANVDVEEKLEREDNLQIYLFEIYLHLQGGGAEGKV